MLRWMVELVLYPAYRDAHIDAEQALQSAVAGRPLFTAHAGQGAGVIPARRAAVTRAEAPVVIPEEWRTATATEVAERLIEAQPKLWAHRKESKRKVATVGEQTLRQIRWAALLLERSMGGRPLWTLNADDLKVLDAWFDKLPTTIGRAPWHRRPETTLEAICQDAADRVEAGDYEADVIGLDVGTTNKHFRKLAQTHEFLRKALDGAIPALSFSDLMTPDIKNERDGRAAYTVEQGKELFLLPPWTGCRSVSDRLEPGTEVYHDSLFFVLLLVWYTGMRREEVCKLLITDILVEHNVWHISIRFTEAGRVKNNSAVRLIAICDELMRLGFLQYVEAIRAAGHTAVFPELVSERDGAKKGDTFYKLWWIYLKPMLPSLQRGQALHAARHMVDTELKALEVFPETRDDALGHKGKGEGPTRYAKATRLRKLKELVDKIPVVTDHLPEFSSVRLLPLHMRRPRPMRSSQDS
jgi:integrase